ncbi:haloacid dehalogenase [Xylanimonas allomyrinae]|uniref:Haloacid dehalogenase n=1 Tax=Xylanimonas allomyrinae TaxID=2509459 RepID=A0A4P6ENV3_9MICO|nr:HAD hydrolase family protein [Xylanimonas allomyrinae]QAY64392.1 haloacid dehalogenase [Xylanimonas allomyrinae]
MNLPRLVATDLDGTLLRGDGTISARTRRALGAAERAGVEVVFVTARPPRWLGHLADVVGGHGRVVCLGGAAVWDLASGAALDVRGFGDDDARAVVADLRAALPGVALAFERVDGPVYDAAFRSGESLDPAWVTPAVESALGRGAAPVGKILALDTPRQAPAEADDGPGAGKPWSTPATAPVTATAAQEAFFARVRDAVGARAHLAYSGAGGLAELLAPDVTKDAALARWCAGLGIDAADVWAFGDMPNDLPMLRWAGRGHAVANAHPQVLAAADAVVGSNDDDGVAVALEAAMDAALGHPRTDAG